MEFSVQQIEINKKKKRQKARTFLSHSGTFHRIQEHKTVNKLIKSYLLHWCFCCFRLSYKIFFQKIMKCYVVKPQLKPDQSVCMTDSDNGQNDNIGNMEHSRQRFELKMFFLSVLIKLPS